MGCHQSKGLQQPFPSAWGKGEQPGRISRLLCLSLIHIYRSAKAENGQIIVALVEDEATVKRFYREDGRFRLQPENDDFAPILLDQVQVLGVVVGVIRYY